MPDLSLDPSTLTFNAHAPSTPVQSKLNGVTSQTAQKAAKPANTVPRVDLEPLYTTLKGHIGEFWAEYKEAMGLFVMGLLNQEEFALRTDHFLCSDPTIEHAHNQLIVGILLNVGRDPPEPGVAHFVSANDKPVVLSKPVSGDAAEQRLKTEVMQLPARDRRRLKDVQEPENQDPIPSMVAEYQAAKQFKIPSDAGAGGKTNWDLEIRKRYTQPLASETGEFPDPDAIQARMIPICYEESLPHGASAPCASLMTSATESYIKEVLSSIFNRVRANIPGGSVNSVLRHHFKRQLQREEDGLLRGEISKVTGTGLLPVEAKESSTRKGLAVHDLKLALRVGDVGLGQFPTALARVANGYEEGEYEGLMEQREKEKELRTRGRKSVGGLRLPGAAKREERGKVDEEGDVKMNGVVVNGVAASSSEIKGEVEDEPEHQDWGWEGGSSPSRLMLAEALEDCLNMDF